MSAQRNHEKAGRGNFQKSKYVLLQNLHQEAELCPCKWILAQIHVTKIWNTSVFPYANLLEKQPLVLTYNKKNLHCNVTDCCAPRRRQVIITNEANVVRYRHGNIKRRQ